MASHWEVESGRKLTTVELGQVDVIQGVQGGTNQEFNAIDVKNMVILCVIAPNLHP